MLTVLLFFLGFLFLIVLTGLVWPSRIRVEATLSGTRWQALFGMSFLAGLHGFRLRFKSDRRSCSLHLFEKQICSFPLRNPHPGKEDEDSAPKKKQSLRNRIAEIGRFKSTLKQYSVLLKDLFRLFRVHEFRLDLDFGLLNPAATGAVYGLILPLTKLLPHPVDVRLNPDFMGFQLEGRFRAETTVSLIKLIPLIGKMLFQKRSRFRKLRVAE